MGQDSSVGIATRYGLNDTGIEFPVRASFPHSSSSAVGPTQPPIQTVPGLFPRVKRSGRGVDNPPHLAARLEKEKSYTSAPPMGLGDLL